MLPASARGSPIKRRAGAWRSFSGCFLPPWRLGLLLPVVSDQESIISRPSALQAIWMAETTDGQCRLTGAPLKVVAEKTIDLRHRHGVREDIEAAFGCDLLRRPHEGTPCNAGERAADTDATHAEAREIRHGETGRS